MKLNSLDMFVITELGFEPYFREGGGDILCYVNPETKSEWRFKESEVCFSSSIDKSSWDIMVDFEEVNEAFLNELKTSDCVPEKINWSNSRLKPNEEIISVFEKLVLYFSENARPMLHSD